VQSGNRLSSGNSRRMTGTSPRPLKLHRGAGLLFVEIALAEFPTLSSRAIAELCGVDHKTVMNIRPDEVGNFPSSTRTGLDGKQYPAKMPKRPAEFKTPPAFNQPTGGGCADACPCCKSFKRQEERKQK
jgi:hypothetical protein